MLNTKTLDLGFPYRALTFFTLEEVIRQTPDETIFRRDLYMADTGAKDGMRLIRRGDLLLVGKGHGRAMKICGATEEEIRAGALIDETKQDAT